MRQVSIVSQILFVLAGFGFLMPAAESRDSRPELMLNLGHSGDVDAVAVSPDGKVIATLGGNEVLLRAARTGQLLRRLPRQKSHYGSLAFLRNGRILASGGSDITRDGYAIQTEITLWNTDRWRMLRHFKLAEPAAGIAFDLRGLTVACGTRMYPRAPAVHLRSLRTGRVIRIYRGLPGAAECLVFSPDGKLLAGGCGGGLGVNSAGRDQVYGDVCIWRVQSRRVVREFHPAHLVAFSPDGRSVATDDYLGHIVIRNRRNWRPARIFKAGYSPVHLVFSPNSRLLGEVSVVDSPMGVMAIWSAQSTGRRQNRGGWSTSFEGPMAFTPDNRRIATGEGIWNIATRKKLWSREVDTYPVNSLAFSSDGRRLASGHGTYDVTGAVLLWDIRKNRPERMLRPKSIGGVFAVAFSADGRLLAEGHQAGQIGGTAALWEVGTGKQRATWGHHGRPVDAVAFLGGHGTIASGASWAQTGMGPEATGDVQISDTKDLKLWYQSYRLDALAPDKTVVAGGAGNNLRLWNLKTGHTVRILRGHRAAVRGAAFSPDGRLLVSRSIDGTLKLWNARTGQLQHTWPLGTSNWRTNAVAISRNGLVATNDGDTVKIYSIRRGVIQRTLTAHEGPVLAVAFSPDGRTLATGSEDRTVRLWDARDGHLLLTILALPEVNKAATKPRWIAFTPQGYYDASPTARPYIRWRSHGRILPASAFERRMHRPSLIRRVLRGRT